MDNYTADREARVLRVEAKYANLFYKALLKDVEPAVVAFEHTGSYSLAAALATSKHVKQVLQALYLEAMPAAAKAEYLHLVGEYKALPVLPITEWLRAARNYVAVESSKAIVAITNTTRNLVKQTLKESLVEGASIQETAKNMRAKVAQFSRKRAITIARTEGITAQNAGSYTGALSTGLALDKVWLAASDGRTRDTHAEANGQRVPLKDTFSVGGETCRYPGDTTLSAAEKINCRCSIGYKPSAKPVQTSFNF